MAYIRSVVLEDEIGFQPMSGQPSLHPIGLRPEGQSRFGEVLLAVRDQSDRCIEGREELLGIVVEIRRLGPRNRVFLLVEQPPELLLVDVALRKRP